MKVKRRRDDFIVRELSRLELRGGPYSTYRLEKSGIGTPEAIAQALSRWQRSQKDVSHGGLKDRHAVTTQTISIYNGPHENLDAEHYTLQYLGQSQRPFTAQNILGNEFELQLRDLDASIAERMLASVLDPAFSVPNYFDQQRFGSVGVSGDFIAQPWCLAHYERALFLAIAEHNSHDQAVDREQKEILREHWGDWQACKDRLDRSNRRSIVTYLVDHPQGFKKAIALINRDLRSIYVSAFQSKLWNEIASRWIGSLVDEADTFYFETVVGRLAVPQKMDSETFSRLADCKIPLPSGRKTNWPVELRGLLEAVVAEFGLQVHQLRFSHPRDVFFSRALRDLLIVPQDVSAEVTDDEFSEATDSGPKRSKLGLRFRLQSGQYATMLVKGLELAAQPGSARP